jgi:hypothetical protein
MTRLTALVWPTLLLCLASLGTGLLCLAPTRLRARLPLWLYASIAFALGQGVLGTAFEFIALAGRFTPKVVTSLVSLMAIAGIVPLVLQQRDWRREAARSWQAWRAAPVVWRCVALAAAAFFAWGFSTLGNWMIVDAPAFYMAIAKMVGGTGRLIPLPGYDPFSRVGLLAELHMAALYALGMRGTDPRILPFASFVPAMALFYGLARVCGLTRRGALLTLVMVLSSTAVVILWGSGKTDLLALGPAIGACILSLVWWDDPADAKPLAVAGLLTGFACVIKLSYIVAFIPAVAVLAGWKAASDAWTSRAEAWRGVTVLIMRAAVFFAAGFVVAFVPHLIKNWLLFGDVSTQLDMVDFYSKRTTIRLLMTYPFALTYGRYWGQIGTISPLVLAYAPLAIWFSPNAPHWARNRLLAITVAAGVGMAAWMILCPSIFAPRYFLATPLLFALPAAAVADTLSRRHALLSLLVAPAVFVVLAATPQQAYGNAPVVDTFRQSLSRLLSPQGPCTGSYPFADDCAAEQSINTRAFRGDRVLILSYVRMWLRADLLLSASTSGEAQAFFKCSAPGCDASQFWTIFRTKARFQFVLHDKTTHVLRPGLFDSAPPDVRVVRLSSSPTVDSYQVTFDAK